MPRKSKLALKAQVSAFEDLLFPSLEGLERLAGKWGPTVFGNVGPLMVELGCGRGGFVCGVAERLPEVNFLALEVKADRCVRAARKLSTAAVRNVRVMCGYLQVFWPVLGTAEVDRFFVNFPDPWPKRRSEKHRMLHAAQLPLLREKIVPGGTIHLRTDQKDFVEWVDTQVEGTGFALSPAPTDDPVWEEVEGVHTEYEARFRANGCEIYYRHLRAI